MPFTIDWTSLLLGLASALLLAALVGLPLALRAAARAREEGRASRQPELDAAEQLRARAGALEQQLMQHGREAASAVSRAESAERGLAETRAQLDRSAEQLQRLSSEHAGLRARAEEQALAAAEKQKLLDQAEARLGEAFGNLAQKILDDKAERFREQSNQQLGGLLDPLKLQLKEFRDTVTRTHAEEQRERGMLAQQIVSLKELNQRISEDAVNLTRALKGDSRSQGAWGELVLERVLEMSGLERGRNYELQVVFSDEDGGRPRPDVVVRLPDSKDLVIDAKVSLTAYERATSATDLDEREGHLREHVASMRRHIEGLGRRDYAAIEGLRTLDFVLLFVPVEAAFVEAVRMDDGLYAHALNRNIAIVSPSTLLATLRTVAHLWKLEDRNVNAMEIARQAGALHDGFVLLEQELTQVGDQLNRALRSHDSAVKRISSGRGNLVGRIEKLRKLGAAARKELPERLLEQAVGEDDEVDDEVPAQSGGDLDRERDGDGDNSENDSESNGKGEDKSKGKGKGDTGAG